MSKTKKRILLAALKLFNQNGFVNVRLQHIADECNMSVGNLAYHFYSKEAIITSLINELGKKQSILLANYMAVPLFEHIDNILEQNYKLQQLYQFFYLDTLEVYRSFNKIKKISQTLIKQQIIQIEGMFLFNASRGAFIKNKDYKLLANAFWMMGHLWMYEQHLLGHKTYTLEAYKTRLWLILKPYFTLTGNAEYENLISNKRGGILK